MRRQRALQWLSIGLLASACGEARDEPGSGGASASPGPSSGAAAGGSGAGAALGTGAMGAAPTAGTGAATAGGAPAAAGAGTAPGGAGGVLVGSCDDKGNALETWPGSPEVDTLDDEPQFQANLSGLTFDPSAGVLWAVDNIPGTLYRLVRSGDGFVIDSQNDWSSGKGLRYPSGDSAPDAEGVTFGASVSAGIYVCAEHDNGRASSSRQSVLRFDATASGDTLIATHDWDLTAVLPPAPANAGIEAITWVPDRYLTERGFLDEAKQHPYVPSEYPEHGDGLFFVGVEEGGAVHVLALDHANGAASLLATFATPYGAVMGLEFARDTSELWFSCDETCDNQSGIFGVDDDAKSPSYGRFVLLRRFLRPVGLPNANHEGIALGGESGCVDGQKAVFWADDNDTDGFALRQGGLKCGGCP
jgi:hypothetical protein